MHDQKMILKNKANENAKSNEKLMDFSVISDISSILIIKHGKCLKFFLSFFLHNLRILISLLFSSVACTFSHRHSVPL